MNNIELAQKEVEKLELEIENLRCGISDWATMYNVDSKEDAEQILNEEYTVFWTIVFAGESLCVCCLETSHQF